MLLPAGVCGASHVLPAEVKTLSDSLGSTGVLGAVL
jgi:hypothetical protein